MGLFKPVTGGESFDIVEALKNATEENLYGIAKGDGIPFFDASANALKKITPGQLAYAMSNDVRVTYASLTGYTGTGTYGYNNACSLSGVASPKLVIITPANYATDGSKPFILWCQGGYNHKALSSDTNGTTVQLSGGKLQWWNATSAEAQCNVQNEYYYVLVITSIL